MAIQGPGGSAYNPGPIKPPAGTVTLPNGTKVASNNVTNPQTAFMLQQSSPTSGPTGVAPTPTGYAITPPGQPAPAMSTLPSPHAPSIQPQTAPPMAPPPAAAAPPSNAPPGEMYGPQFGETYGKSHIGQYDKPTMLEDFAQSQMNGNNPYYDRLRQQGMDQINQQMVARGHGNSGGAMAALGNFQGALGAAQFKDMADLAGGASGIGLQRQGQGNQMATGIQGLQQQRMGQQFGELSDLAHLGAGTTGGFFGQGGQLSGDAAMAGINAGTNASQLEGQGKNGLVNTGMQLFNGYLGSR
jgi:hypothetical protein